VDDFAASRVRHAKDETEAKKAKEKTSNSDYFFIYHPSTNWHASFEALQSQKTFTNIVAVCHRIDVLEKEIRKLRKSIGPEPKIYILMPSLHKYDLNEGLALDQSLLPFIFEGELGFLTEPYVTLNVPQLNDSHFYRIGRGSGKKPTGATSSSEIVGGLNEDSFMVRVVAGACLGLMCLCFAFYAGFCIVVIGLFVAIVICVAMGNVSNELQT
jgi:hypothetical protein